MNPIRGVLHLVVGASGVGKDTLIDAARAARPDIAVARRVVTRAAEAGGEAHDAVTNAEFDRMLEAGAFALAWRAHGLGYGVRAELAATLAAPRHAIVNVSRRIVDEARARLAPVRVLYVFAAPEALAARLAARGRESAHEIAERLARAADPAPSGPDVHPIDNGGALEAGVAAFLAALAPPLTPRAESAGAA